MLFVLDDGVPSEGKWIKVQRQQSTDYEITQGRRIWGGDVWLDRDFEVAAACTLQVLAGTRVHVKANVDRANRGVSSGKVEVIHRGTTLMPGTVAQPITFTTYDGSGVAGEWYGHRFILDGCERSGYGYMGAVNPPSVIEHATIENAEYGVKIEDFVAPSLKGVEFVNITNRRDIYLDRTDVFIPAGYWPSGVCNNETPAFVYAPSSWSLLGGTDVVASTATPMVDAGFVGVAGKVDLVGNGPVATVGSAAAGDSVYFVPETITPIGLVTAGADWGGFTLSTESSGSNLRYAQIGYAANPLFVSYPDGTSFSHCLIHHFAGLGIWFQGSLANGAVLDSSVVDRGLELHESLGDAGIYADQADETHILTTLVNLQGREDETGGVGIEVRYGKTFCEWTPPDSRLLVIDNCQVLGPSQDVQTGSAYSGIRTNWVCGSLLRDCDITKNYIAGWKFVGLELLQTADVQLTCNRVALCRSGVDIYRDQEPAGTSLRFRRNQLQAAEQSPTRFAVRSNNNPRTKLGPNWAQTYGLNQLTVNVNDTKFVVEEDATVDNILNAQDNFWFTTNGTSATLQTTETPILNRIQESPADQVDIDGFETTLPPFDQDCNPSPPSLNLQGLQSVVSDDPAPTGASSTDLPRELELGTAFPNPASGAGFSLSLAVPPGRTGAFTLEVYDLRGRRLVSTKQDVESGGRFRLSWDGRTGERIKVSAGIYFLRVTGPGGFEETRKVTVLR